MLLRVPGLPSAGHPPPPVGGQLLEVWAGGVPGAAAQRHTGAGPVPQQTAEPELPPATGRPAGARRLQQLDEAAGQPLGV